MAIKIEAGNRLMAADKEEKRSVRNWMGTNGRYNEVQLLAKVFLILEDTTPEFKTTALKIQGNKECTLAELDACVKGMIKDVKQLIPTITGNAKASMDSAKMDTKGE